MLVGWDSSAVDLLASRYGGRNGDEGFRPLLNAIDSIHDDLREAWHRQVLQPG